MKNFFIVLTILTPVLCGRIDIQHNDKYDRSSSFIDEDDTYHSYINQQNDGGVYTFKNLATGITTKIQKTAIKNQENEVIGYRNKLSHDGRNYEFDFYTEDEQQREEKGAESSEGLKVDGTFSYVDSNGNRYIQGYMADKNGFRTKVAFGSKVMISYSAIKSPAYSPPRITPQTKGIDSLLLCSLAGSGCK